MIEVRKSKDRGHAEHGWLDSRHTFSFADYYDPKHMGFSDLRVINEDRVQPGKGFERHPHRDMEIISYVLEGELEHKDSMGTGSVIRAGDAQRMSAGSGVTHSEFNPSNQNIVHFLQIWILPEKKGVKPEYEQKRFSRDERLNQLRLIVSHSGEGGSIRIHQDVKLYAGILDPGTRVSQELAAGRRAWLQVASGSVEAAQGRNSMTLEAGDGAAILPSGSSLQITSKTQAEILLFDLK